MFGIMAMSPMFCNVSCHFCLETNTIEPMLHLWLTVLIVCYRWMLMEVVSHHTNNDSKLVLCLEQLISFVILNNYRLQG